MMITAIDCEACGGPGATVIDYPCGATAEMCGPCIADEIRQAAIDANPALDDTPLW